jgi:type IVB pilus formation R64 PilN family outer membrane protein
MKKLLLIIFFTSLFLTIGRAETKDYVYDGKEVYVHVKKDHVTVVIFPEPINGVIRGFGADSYVVQRNDKEPNILELMPTDSEVAEMTLRGMSGENYVLRFVANDNFYTKLIIRRMAASVDKNEDKTIAAKMDILPEAIIEKKGKTINIPDHDNQGEESNLPPELNLKITLKGNGLPLKTYLSTISQAMGYNVITTPEIDSQNTSINVENIEVWRALKSLLYKFGWGFKVSKEDLIITALETRIFNIRMPAVDQTFTDQTSNESYTDNQNNSTNNSTNNSSSNNSGNQQGQDIRVGTKIFYENSATKLSLWTDLESSIKSLVTPQVGSYSISKSSGTITVTDKPGVLDKIAEIIKSTNEILSRQQTFEIQIYEVTLSNANETGVDWGAVETSLKGVNALSLATNYSSVGFVGGQLLSLSGNASNSGTNGISAVLKALSSQGDVHTISKPKITVTNLFPAVIQEVTSIPYISGTGQTIGNNVTQSNVTTSEVSDGLTMRLEAKMSDDNKTVLNVSVAVNTLDSMTTVPAGGGLSIQEPQVSTKSITTNVEIESGKTLILGGLISTTKKNEVQGVPYLSRIPFLGNAFEYKNISNTRSELVIFISPMKIEKDI